MSSVAIQRLVETATSLAAAPAGELPDAQVAEELLALRKLADVAEAAYLSRLAVFDTRGLAQADALSTGRGCATTRTSPPAKHRGH